MRSEQWFDGCKTAQEIKTRYRELCRKYHPDLGGDTATMQAINAAYTTASAQAQRQDRPDKSEGAYSYYAEADEKIREAISRIVTLPNIQIEICGWWAWVSGDTRSVKDQLKNAGYRWASNKGMWYYAGCSSKGKGHYSIDDIRATYGSTKVESQPLNALG